MAARKKTAGPTPVEATTHADTRVNIPTGELAGFVAEDEQAPKEQLYPRDPTLDPQLVWKGKDAQDLAEHLAVATVPVYIQEKIDPRALVENLRATAAVPEDEPELRLFDDFDGLEFDDLVDFYAHEGNWSNRMILGDSLLVMNSLATKERMAGKVQMVFLDPPYGIKFGSNWQVSTRKREVSDGKDIDVTRQPEQIKAFRDTWELGIHSYLGYLRDRLTVARELLTESGSCFVQIGDENVHLVRNLMDEVLGAENFVSLITYAKTSGTTGDLLPGTADYIVWYAKSKDHVKFRRLFLEKVAGAEGGTKYTSEGDDGRVFRLDNLTSQSQGREKGEGAASWFEVDFGGAKFNPTMQSRWKTNEAGMSRLLAAGRIARSGKLSPTFATSTTSRPSRSPTHGWTLAESRVVLTPRCTSSRRRRRPCSAACS